MEEQRIDDQSNDQDDVAATINEKDLAEKLDKIGWALFFVWLGISFLADLGTGIGLLGIGIITLGIQLTRNYSKLKVEGFWIIVGLLFVIGGLGNLSEVEIPLVPIVLILAGLALLYSVIKGNSQK